MVLSVVARRAKWASPSCAMARGYISGGLRERALACRENGLFEELWLPRRNIKWKTNEQVPNHFQKSAPWRCLRWPPAAQPATRTVTRSQSLRASRSLHRPRLVSWLLYAKLPKDTVTPVKYKGVIYYGDARFHKWNALVGNSAQYSSHQEMRYHQRMSNEGSSKGSARRVAEQRGFGARAVRN